MPTHPGRHGHAWRKASAHTLAPNPLVCWLCGSEIDKRLPYPHPMSKSVDHVITLKQMRHLPMAEQRRLALDPTNLKPAHLRHNISRGDGTRVKRTTRRQSQEW